MKHTDLPMLRSLCIRHFAGPTEYHVAPLTPPVLLDPDHGIFDWYDTHFFLDDGGEFFLAAASCGVTPAEHRAALEANRAKIEAILGKPFRY